MLLWTNKAIRCCPFRRAVGCATGISAPARSTAASSLRTRFSTQKSGSDHHAFFQQQMKELEQERKTFFRDDEDTAEGAAHSNPKTGSEHHAFFQQQLEELESERKSFFGDSLYSTNDATKSQDFPELARKLSSKVEGTSSSPEIAHGTNDLSEIDLDELHAEREALFQFSDQEKQAWGGNSRNLTQTTISPEIMAEIERARTAAAAQEDDKSNNTISRNTPPTDTQVEANTFTHLSEDGKSIHMVDVGAKEVTARTAKAQTKVILPDEVLKAFELSLDLTEMVGTKGPIFSTAKLAGIMAAKKTSDLIPLCHPLPLDQVQVEIFMENESVVVIECTCRVTHKTGVEMEALTGASVAALCIYDMVKAVSHQVEITSTKLISKSGGKRNIEEGKPTKVED